MSSNHNIPDFHIRSRLSIWFRKILDRTQPSEDFVLLTTAVVVGIGTGIGAIVFRYLITMISWIGYEWLPGIMNIGKLYIVIIPGVGGLLAGILIYNFAREAKGHGVPEVMQALALRGGRIRPVVAVIKSVASAITIGSGGSAGSEGPIVQIGAVLGSTVGQMLHLSEDRVRNLVACGAAGGIAAIFNAPIAGVFFALEVIIGEFGVRHFSMVVISAVVSSVIGRVTFGDVAAFSLPMEYGVTSLWEYAFYPILGLVAGIWGAFYVWSLYATEDLFDDWKSVPEWVKPAIGGTLLGVVALLYPLLTNVTWDTTPQIFGAGYEIIEDALAGRLLVGTAILFMVLKAVATNLTLGSGGSGGVFAPGLFMGAMLGTSFGIVMGELFPGVASPPGAYALLGMAAVFSATAHAPITAIMILSELTGDHRIILPLMLTVIVATMLSRALLKNESIYTLKLSRRGISIERGHDIDLMQGITVREAMILPAPTIDADATLLELKKRFRDLSLHALCTTDEEGNLSGIVTLSDLQLMYEYSLTKPDVNIARLKVGQICKLDAVTIYSDDALWAAIKTMGTRGIGQLPVLQSGTNKLVGMVSRDNVMNAYNMAITYKLRDQHRSERMRLNVLTGAHVLEMRLAEGMPVIGKKIQDISWPKECIIAAISRKNKLIVPHGDTELRKDDMLTVLVEPEAEEELGRLFGGGKLKNS
jgi:chloride channel protein, CIC family